MIAAPKAKSHRQLLLAPETVVALRDHLRPQREERLRLGPAWTDSGYLFVDEAGVEYHPQRFTKLFAEAVGPTAATSTTPRWSRSPPHSRTATPAPTVTEDNYELIVARPAACAIADNRPEAVSAAVIDFITESLIGNPRRMGRELRNELAGIHSARRGSYRVLHRIDEVANRDGAPE